MPPPTVAPVRTIEWRDDTVRFLDQTRLPEEESYIETGDYRTIAEAIVHLRLRGAPLIGIAAAYGVALAAFEYAGRTPAATREGLAGAIGRLRSTRPTAVNLFAALSRMERLIDGAQDETGLPALALAEARMIHEEDARMCRAIGEHGAGLLPDRATVITHCNAGALATGGIGTALGVIVTAAGRKGIVRVYAGETRPLFQGARLTAWELGRAGVPVTVVTDGTVPFLMQREKIDAVIIGADRISRNGDVANKIGSYGLAIAAAVHGVPFYVAAPSTTIDSSLENGGGIPIEERDPREVGELDGRRIVAPGAAIRSPAFDVTPSKYVGAIITERGVHRPPYDFREIPGQAGSRR